MLNKRVDAQFDDDLSVKELLLAILSELRAQRVYIQDRDTRLDQEDEEQRTLSDQRFEAIRTVSDKALAAVETLGPPTPTTRPARPAGGKG